MSVSIRATTETSTNGRKEEFEKQMTSQFAKAQGKMWDEFERSLTTFKMTISKCKGCNVTRQMLKDFEFRMNDLINKYETFKNKHSSLFDFNHYYKTTDENVEQYIKQLNTELEQELNETIPIINIIDENGNENGNETDSDNDNDNDDVTLGMIQQQQSLKLENTISNISSTSSTSYTYGNMNDNILLSCPLLTHNSSIASLSSRSEQSEIRQDQDNNTYGFNAWDDVDLDLECPIELSLCTAKDKSMIHNVINVPGITMNKLTDDIKQDIINNVSKFNHLMVDDVTGKIIKINYKQAIKNDLHFDATKKVFDFDMKENNNDDSILMMNNNVTWKSNDSSMVGAQLIERKWIRVADDNKMENKNNDYSFSVMQFNLLADGLSGGYLDTSKETLNELSLSSDSKDNNNNNIIDKWNDKIEKSFYNVNPLCLQWNYRGLRLIEEILRLNCDICGFEECDQPQFINSYLKQYKYKMIFQPKIDSPCINTISNCVSLPNKNRKANKLFENEHKRFETAVKDFDNNKFSLPKDGCVVAFKTDVFEIVSKDIQKIESVDDMKKWMNNNNNDNTSLSVQCSVVTDLYDMDKPIFSDNQTGNKIIGYSKLEILDKKKTKIQGKKVIKSFGTTFIALHMRHKLTKNEFLFVVTHLKSTKSFDGEKIRRSQIAAMFDIGPYQNENESENNKSNQFIPKPLIKNPNNLPILMCCDLNAKPYNTMCKNGKDILYGCQTYQSMINLYNFESLYACANKNEEPIYTTWKERKDGSVKHTIDYIFSKGNIFDITHYLSIPNIDAKIHKKALLPDWHYPSDHFALALKLQWK